MAKQKIFGMPPQIWLYRRRYAWFGMIASSILMVLFFLEPTKTVWFVIIGQLVNGGTWAAIWVARKRLRKRVELENYRMCIICGYLLHGLEDCGKCPECGTDYELGMLALTWRGWLG